jgi:hypothetical protein
MAENGIGLVPMRVPWLEHAGTHPVGEDDAVLTEGCRRRLPVQ